MLRAHWRLLKQDVQLVVVVMSSEPDPLEDSPNQVKSSRTRLDLNNDIPTCLRRNKVTEHKPNIFFLLIRLLGWFFI